jgi:hypothetical protein
LTVTCGTCSERFMVSDEVVGTKVVCPSCSKPVHVAAPTEDILGPMAEEAWEYMILADHGRMGHIEEKQLNRAGREGWELAGIFRDSVESNTRFFFKRRLKG